MSNWLNRMFKHTADRGERFEDRAEDRMETAGEHSVSAEAEVEFAAHAGVEGSWTDEQGRTHDWGNETTLDTGRTELGLTISADPSETSLEL